MLLAATPAFVIPARSPTRESVIDITRGIGGTVTTGTLASAAAVGDSVLPDDDEAPAHAAAARTAMPSDSVPATRPA